jgi:hypothetical protein
LRTKLASVDVEAILKILVGRLDEDVWAWNLERHGNFTVRSAYIALLQENANINLVMGSGQDEQSFLEKNYGR